MTNKVQLGAWVAPSVKAAIKRATKQERRSLSALVEVILLDWLEAQRKKRQEERTASQ